MSSIKNHVLKRLFDLFCSSLALLFLGVPMLFLALLVKIKLGGPVLFTQTRPGLYGRPFLMMKFRSMTNERGPDGELLPDSVRLTSFGRFLRSTSLDELPGLLNVWLGDMSLVGPRPLLMEYLPLYTKEQARRHDVRPGLTGWAQANGRNTLSWSEKFEHDVWYVDHQNFLLDLNIIGMTIIKVFKRDGINAAGEATMSKFTGNTTAPNTSSSNA